MLDLLFAVAFSAAPLTLYFPPLRILNPFMEAIEMLVREAGPYPRRIYLRFHLGFNRILAALARAIR